MLSIRMRASKKTKACGQGSLVGRRQRDMHISGAEGIYEEKDARKICGEYLERALTHPRGKPDEISITIEKLGQKPGAVSLLPVTTLRCELPDEAREIITLRLTDAGISKKAAGRAFKVLNSKRTMRGASLMLAKAGRRVEPDKDRGVRVSRLGIGKNAERKLSQKLSRANINTTTVKEALILASKAAWHPDIIAEVCVSDDPDYTTGYIASKKFGYLRISNIKRRGNMRGGRVLFIKDDADVGRLIDYLERKPVILY